MDVTITFSNGTATMVDNSNQSTTICEEVETARDCSIRTVDGNTTITYSDYATGLYKGYEWRLNGQTFTVFYGSLQLSKEVESIDEGIAFIERKIAQLS